MKVWIAGALGFLLIGGMALAQEPVGEQFQVNSYTTGMQWDPAVAADAQGNFVVVWGVFGSYGTDTSGQSIQGQRYDASGTPVGGQFQVNSYTTSTQRSAAVAADAQGNFVVVWMSHGSYGTAGWLRSIQGQRYDASGTAVGGQFQVNTCTTSHQNRPAVAVDGQGNFVVVWDSWCSHGTDTDGLSIQGQRYDASGTPAGGQFQVNSYTTARQYEAAVAAGGQGNFVVVWESWGSYGTDTSTASVQARLYDASGTPVGGQFQVNTYTMALQYKAAVAADGQGDFVVVWAGYGSYGTDTGGYGRLSIQGQRYDASGTPAGGQFQVNTYTTGSQNRPAVAMDAQGHFAVVWDSDGSYGTDTDRLSIQGQFYGTNDTPVGEQVQVNSCTTDWQYEAAVAADGQGNFVAVWESWCSYGTDANGQSIQGQRYAPGLIFADGFELGVLCEWWFAWPVPDAPCANFQFITLGLTATFNNTSWGTQPLSYLWDFGDGTTPPYQTEPNPVHTYISPATYNVTLTVTNAFGMHSITKPVTVTN